MLLESVKLIKSTRNDYFLKVRKACDSTVTNRSLFWKLRLTNLYIYIAQYALKHLLAV